MNISIYFKSGASSGIGAGTAVYFAKNGAKVAITGRNEENLKKIAQKCEEDSPTNEKVWTLFENFVLFLILNDPPGNFNLVFYVDPENSKIGSPLGEVYPVWLKNGIAQLIIENLENFYPL